MTGLSVQCDISGVGKIIHEFMKLNRGDIGSYPDVAVMVISKVVIALV
jgi:hypothetical protein